MSVIDWGIVLVLLSTITWTVLYTKKYNRSIGDFLVANRSAGRYLLTVGDGMAGLGAISIIAGWELVYNGGFPIQWWQYTTPLFIAAVIGLTGWVFYRFRQTRALTLAQFFEKRYGKGIRIYAGILMFVAGIANFGIFPAVASRFFMSFIGIEETTANYAAFLFVLISIALFFTFIGGQIAVMIADFIQGSVSSIAFIVITGLLLYKYDWNFLSTALSTAEPGQSLINPFDIAKAKDFNPTYYIALISLSWYAAGAWQGNQGYNAAARNPHEARMGKSLSFWRQLIVSAFILVVPLTAFSIMHHPESANIASQVNEQLHVLEQSAGSVIARQATTTLVLKSILPTGIAGLLCAVMLSAFISTNDTYLHSWGSILIQDVIMPFRKKPFTPKMHMLILRLSIIGVAIFIFLFSLLFSQVEYITMFFSITAGIIAGSGALIIGGLYWERGATAGAWFAMSVGPLVCVPVMALQQINKISPFANKYLHYIATRNGIMVSVFASFLAMGLYIIVSLIANKKCDLDKVLNRGKYAIADDATNIKDTSTNPILKRIGINKDFNMKDRILYISVMASSFLLITTFITVSIVNTFHPMSDRWWMSFWKIYVYIFYFFGGIVSIWLIIGGVKDVKKMFARLKSLERDDSDDGTV